MQRRTLILGGGLLLAVLALGAAGGAALAYAAFRMVTPAVAAALPQSSAVSEDAGILVAHVVPDSTATKAGLRRGDIVLKVNGEAVNEVWQLEHALRDAKAGDSVELTVQRGDDMRALTATLTEDGVFGGLGLLACGAELGVLDFGAAPFLRDIASGAVILDVVKDSPAEAAGLAAGDRIMSVDGDEVAPETTLAELIGAHKPGDTVTLAIARSTESERREIEVTLGEDPEAAGKAYLGVRYSPALFAPAEGRSLNERPFFHEPGFAVPFPEGIEQGAIIGEVQEDSPAARAGLQPGDVITEIDGEPVSHPRALAEAVAARQPGESLPLTLSRDGETRTVVVTLGEKPGEAGAAYLGVTVSGFFLQRFEIDPNVRPFFDESPMPVEPYFDEDA